jgi:hypothetical protein
MSFSLLAMLRKDRTEAKFRMTSYHILQQIGLCDWKEPAPILIFYRFRMHTEKQYIGISTTV